MTAYNFLQRGRNTLLYVLIELFLCFIIYLNTSFGYKEIFLFFGIVFLLLGGIFTINRGSRLASGKDEESPSNKGFLSRFKHTCLDIYYFSSEFIISSFILILFSL
ncbi:hypothetical protein [Clostridium chrysemydis]|uniref:hypothetical protein n=1 Tax=Clostridium chrysemydis TaxID=2665504 RepID=UPI0018842667|nr:hypothetical protein [Clostridium chrysemydis]